MFGKWLITFGYFLKASGELWPASKYLWWPSLVFECLRTNFDIFIVICFGVSHNCTLTYFQICSSVTWKLHSFFANQNQVIFSTVARRIMNTFYYIDTGVLLKNIPLVKFIKTTSGTVRKILFCHSKIKFISSRPRVISSI